MDSWEGYAEEKGGKKKKKLSQGHNSKCYLFSLIMLSNHPSLYYNDGMLSKKNLTLSLLQNVKDNVTDCLPTITSLGVLFDLGLYVITE